MSELILLHNPRYSKFRAAFKLLEVRDPQPQVVRYLETLSSIAKLKAIPAKFGVPARQLLRIGEDEYKTLDPDELSPGEEAIIEAMAKHPKLIKRPVLVVGDKVVISWSPERVLEILV